MAKTKNKVTISSGLKKDLEKYTVSICKELANKTYEELEDAHQIGMSEFYADYSPIRYKRHYYNFMGKVYKKYYKNPHNKIIYGGIQFSPDFLDRIYRGKFRDDEGNKVVVDTTDLVYDLVFLQGRHGGINYGIPTSVPPIQFVEQRQKSIIRNINTFSIGAIRRANEGAYSYISPS